MKILASLAHFLAPLNHSLALSAHKLAPKDRIRGIIYTLSGTIYLEQQKLLHTHWHLFAIEQLFIDHLMTIENMEFN